MKKVIITGITGQDGSYLAELLLSKQYEVHGIVKKDSLQDDNKLKNIIHIKDKLILHEGSLLDHLSIYKIFSKVIPDECYHLSAYSFVNYSFNDEFQIMNNNINSTHYLLSTIKEVNPKCKFYFAGSSEMFGEPNISPQNEDTPFNPKSIYGISKLSSYFLLKNYREKENIFASTGIMYNHESSRRGSQFVTKKIVSSAVKIKRGLQKELFLGNLDTKRDWGYAPDYVNAMWLILQDDKPNDYILATGKLHSVRELLDLVFGYLGLDYREFVKVDKRFFRQSEQNPLCGNPSKIKSSLGWTSDKDLEYIVQEMVKSELL